MEELDVSKLTSGDVSFFNVNGRVFTLTEVNCKVEDVFNERKEHLSERVASYIANTNRELFNAVEQEGRAELAHISRQMTRGEHSIPTPLVEQNALVAVIDGRVMRVRLHQYAPTCVRGTIYAFIQTFGWDWVSRQYRHIPAFSASVAEGGRIINQLVRLELRFKHPRLPQEGKWFHMAGDDRGVYSNFKTFHTLGRIGYGEWCKQCTGNMSSTQFWNAENFNELLNTVNLDSPATNQVDMGWGAVSVSQLVKAEGTTITSKFVLNPDAWRTA